MQNQISLQELVRRITDTIAEELDDWRRKSRMLAQNRSSQQHTEQQRQSLALWCTRSAQSLRVLYSLLTLLTLPLDDDDDEPNTTTTLTTTATGISTDASTQLVLDSINEWNNSLMLRRYTYQHQLHTIGLLPRTLYGTKINPVSPNQALKFIQDAIIQYNKVHTEEDDANDTQTISDNILTPTTMAKTSTVHTGPKTSLLQYILGYKVLYLQSIIPSYISLGLHLHHIIVRINNGAAVSLTTTGSLRSTSSSLFAITGIYWNGTAIGSLVEKSFPRLFTDTTIMTKPVSKPSYNQLRQIQTVLQSIMDKNRYNNAALTMDQQLHQLIENFNNIINITYLLEIKNNLIQTDNWLHQSNTITKSKDFQPSLTWYPTGHKILVSLWSLPDSSSSTAAKTETEGFEFYKTNKRTSLAIGNTYIICDNGTVYPLQRTLWNTKGAQTMTKLFENKQLDLESLHGTSSSTNNDVYVEGVSTSITEEIHLVIDPETGLPTYASSTSASSNSTDPNKRLNSTKNDKVSSKTATVQTMENDFEMNGNTSPIIGNIIKASKVVTDSVTKHHNPITVLHDQPSPVILSTYLAHAESSWITGETPYLVQKSMVIHNDISQYLYETNNKISMVHKWISNNLASSDNQNILPKQCKPQIVVRQWKTDPPMEVKSIDFPDSVSIISENISNTIIEMINILLSHRPDTKIKAQNIGLHHIVERVPGEILGINPTAKTNAVSQVLLLSTTNALSYSSPVNVRMGIDNRTGEISLNVDHHPLLESINTEIQTYMNSLAKVVSNQALTRTAQVIEAVTNSVSSFISRQNISLEPRISSIIASAADKFAKDIDIGTSTFSDVGMLESRGSIFSAPLGQDRDAAVHSSLFLTSVLRARLLACLLLPANASVETVLLMVENISKYSFQTNQILALLPSLLPSVSSSSRDYYPFVFSLIQFITSHISLPTSNLCDMVGSHIHLPIVNKLFNVSDMYANRLDRVSQINASSRSYIAASLMAVSYAESLVSIMDNIMIMINHSLRIPSVLSTDKSIPNRFIVHENTLQLKWNSITNTATPSTSSFQLSSCGSYILQSSHAIANLAVWIHYGTYRNSTGIISVTPTVLYTVPANIPITVTVRDALSTASGSTYTYPHIRILHKATDVHIEGRPMPIPNDIIQQINHECQSLPPAYRLTTSTSSVTSLTTTVANHVYCVDLPTILSTGLSTFTQILDTTGSNMSTSNVSVASTSVTQGWKLAVQFLQTIVQIIHSKQPSACIMLLLPSSIPSSISLSDLWLPLSFTNIDSTVLLVHDNLGSTIRRALASSHSNGGAGGNVVPSTAMSTSIGMGSNKGRPSMYGSGTRTLLVASALKDPILRITVPSKDRSIAATVYHVLGMVEQSEEILMNDLPVLLRDTTTTTTTSSTASVPTSKRIRSNGNSGKVVNEDRNKLEKIHEHITTFLGKFRT